MSAKSPQSYDLIIVGAGFAGLSAAVFAANKGIKTAVVGDINQFNLVSGLIDVLGVFPLNPPKIWENPWEGVEKLIAAHPQHPYAYLSPATIKTAIDEIIDGLRVAGLAYTGLPDENSLVLTSVGTIKPTYRLPTTMQHAHDAIKNKPPGLIVGIRGLKDFSARQIESVLGGEWSGLRHTLVAFQETQFLRELYPEFVARCLDTKAARQYFIQTISPHVEDAAFVALPSVLGIQNPSEVLKDLEAAFGIPVFEVPTPPVSVGGIRLKEAFARHLTDKGVALYLNIRVEKAKNDQTDFSLAIKTAAGDLTLSSKAVILSSGRFLGKGLVADRNRIQEPLFDLPVSQPQNREEWHRDIYLDPDGHPIHQAGIIVDQSFRPLLNDKTPYHPKLFAAGSIIAHQDWMRTKSGAGIAMGTAYGAVDALTRI